MKKTKIKVHIANGVSELGRRVVWRLVDNYFENPENKKAFEQWKAQRLPQAANERMC